MAFLKKIIRKNSKSEVNSLKQNDFYKLCDTVNSQGILGVVRIPEYFKKSFSETKRNKLIVILENVNDPGNLGTIIRNCYWYDADELLIGENSAELYNPKVIRSSMGALFHLNIRENVNVEKETEFYHNNNFRVYLTDLRADKFSDEEDFKNDRGSAFVFGNESSGLSKKILENKNYIKIKIRGYSNCESLNVAVSSGIMLHEYKKSCPD